MNKIDVILPAGEKWDEVKAIEYYIAQSGEPAPDTVLISAYKRWGFNGLYKLIAAKLPEQIDNTSLQSGVEDG